jgi:hypothetical protein
VTSANGRSKAGLKCLLSTTAVGAVGTLPRIAWTLVDPAMLRGRVAESMHDTIMDMADAQLLVTHMTHRRVAECVHRSCR